MFLSKTFNLDNVTFKLLKIVNVLFNDENTRHKIKKIIIKKKKKIKGGQILIYFCFIEKIMKSFLFFLFFCFFKCNFKGLFIFLLFSGLKQSSFDFHCQKVV
jgi:hypothetical protein